MQKFLLSWIGPASGADVLSGVEVSAVEELAAVRSIKAVAPWRGIVFAALGFIVAAMSTIPVSTAKAEIVQETIEGVNAIFITADIAVGDNAKFRKIVSGLTGKTAVFLKSNGGALYEALAIGESIHDHGFPTVVAAEDTCASACALIWLGGTTRYISPAARVGFHAAYISDGRTISSVGNAVVGAYLTAMKLPIDAVVFATSAPPDAVRWLHPAEAKKVGITWVALKGLPVPPTGATAAYFGASAALVETSAGSAQRDRR